MSDNDVLIVERSISALVKVLISEEKHTNKENEWIEGWYKGMLSLEEINSHLLSAKELSNYTNVLCMVCEVQFGDKDFDPSYYSVIFKSFFKRRGFASLVHYDRNQLIFIIMNKNHKDYRDRLERVLYDIKEHSIFSYATSYNFGFGKMMNSLELLHMSYNTAKETLYLQKKTLEKNKYFFEDFHIYRIINRLDKMGGLVEYIDEYLQPIIDFDKKNKTKLYETLEMLLKVNGSKKEAARQLYVVRQTLYYRIEQLKELLGSDFMNPEKRIAIEVALYGHKLLKNNKRRE
jgi:purine catabolism regulator